MEKQVLNPHNSVTLANQSFTSWRKARTAIAVLIMVCLAAIHLPEEISDQNHSYLTPNARHYQGEHIRWHSCGDVEGLELECSKLAVPMDQFNSTRSGNKTFSIPLVRQRGKNATENLILNPGGPGVSGFDLIYRRGKQFRTIVGEGFHLLTFDPRGINSSTPFATCYANKEDRIRHSYRGSGVVIEESVDLYAWTDNYVQACWDTMGEYAGFINTPQTAADMNSILDAVGQRRMVYWGLSYGTALGQTYATMYPERSERVIIDGVLNHFQWFGELLDLDTFTDTEKVLDGFFDECMKAGSNCTLSRHGQSKEELVEKVTELLDSLQNEPFSVYVNSTVYGVLDYPKLFYGGIFTSLYRPVQWYGLADRLSQLLDGNATEAFLAYGSGDYWGLVGDGDTFVAMNDGKSGPQSWPQDRLSLLNIILPFMNQSVFGPAQNDYYYKKQKWLVPKTHDFKPRKGVQTAHPLLILSTTYDPVCPLVSARSAHQAFEGSKIVEVDGYGHCSANRPSLCAAKHIRAFLYHGTMPEHHVRCESEASYFVRPDEKGKTFALKHFDDAEDREIHLAQMQLAGEGNWRRW